MSRYSARGKILFSVIAVAVPLSVAGAQRPATTPVPPREKCEYGGTGGNETLRRVAGKDPAPFFFACQENNRNAGPTGCVESTVPAGFITSVKNESNGWACIHEEGFVSGWIPSDRLEPIPNEPKPATADWLGWWRNGPDARGVKNDRLLITRGQEPSSLHVSGRAYWYGLNGNVHFGGVTAEAVPVGPYLHVVERADGGCVVELALSRDDKGLKMQADDNQECGGMNVRFAGTWRKFVPTTRKAKRLSK